MEEDFGTTFRREFKKNLVGKADKASLVAFYRYRFFYTLVIVTFFVLTSLFATVLYLVQPTDWGQQAVPLFLLFSALLSGYLTYRFGRLVHKKLIANMVPKDLTDTAN